MAYHGDFWIVEDLPKEDGKPIKWSVQNLTRQDSGKDFG